MPTSRDETDGTEEACLRVVHLDGQQLVGKSEHQVGERPEASVVHLRPVEGQSIRKGHGVLIGGVPCTDAQDLMAREEKTKKKNDLLLICAACTTRLAVENNHFRRVMDKAWNANASGDESTEDDRRGRAFPKPCRTFQPP